MAANPPHKKSAIERRADVELYGNVSPHPTLGEPPEWHREPTEDGWPSLYDRLGAHLTGFTEEEFEAAKTPEPHAFQLDCIGLFPIGEVTVIAAPGREGKTYTTIAVACAFILGISLAGLKPVKDRSVIIYSTEDDRRQYARKVLAKASRLGAEQARTLRERLIVPNLVEPGMEAFQALVTLADRRPIPSLAGDVLLDVLKPRMAEPGAPGLLIFETASTLSEAEEDNLAFRTLIGTLRRIARELQVAVVLVHHTSQAAASNLAELNIAVSDIRGATTLVNNARQCFLLVNLGSETKPFSDNDARTVLRRMACERASGRVSALICLNSSKSIEPPPLFFEWMPTPYGPALSVVPVPQRLEGASWEQLHQLVRAERAEQRQAAKSDGRSAVIRQVVELVRVLHVRGQQPTARAVSLEAGKSPTWARPYLDAAVAAGELRRRPERIERRREPADVYRPADSTEAGA